MNELLPSDDDAAAAVTTILRKREVAQQVVGRVQTRHVLHRAELSHYEQRREQERQAPAAPTASRSVGQRPTEAQREILELLGICTSFYTQTQRAVPRPHVVDHDTTAKTPFSTASRVSAPPPTGARP
ncbi:DUF6192 family protein [Amycolatopsis sp. NPDC004378]